MEPSKQVKVANNFLEALQSKKFLEKTVAAYRTKQINGRPNYKILFQVQEKQDTFNLYQELTFKLNDQAFSGDKDSDYFFIDYDSPITPASVQVNGKELGEEYIKNNWTGNFFNIEKSLLKPGQENTLICTYQNKFVNDGYGLYSFTDVDSKQYIYSHLEPNFCHKIFFNFDQPDLRATYEIALIAPKQWAAIANGKLQSQADATLENINAQFKPQIQFNSESQIVKSLQSNSILTIFEKTVPFSTYIWFLGTGDFSYVELEDSKAYKNIPQKIYCRESLKVHLLKVSDKIFEIMNKLFPFYEKFFGFDFPWTKYDHIFCPDFNIGAMENVGAVTFNDRRIPREAVTTEQFSSVLNVFAHELVHTWFGDLVTMQWWDDLWLKESFADFASYYAISQLELSFPMTCQNTLMNSRKQWGYQCDTKNSTHPISSEVADTQVAKSVFDGISYSKGAATLKQLMFVVGTENFSKAMASYFKKYNYSTATLQDFIDCLSEQFSNPNFTLNQWQTEWLQKGGCNVIQADFNPETSLTEFKISQSAYLEAFPALRNHKIQIGLFKEDATVDVIEQFVSATESTTVKIDNSDKKYKAVLLNYQDYDFVKSVLDENSLNFFIENLYKIDNLLDQRLIVSEVCQMVKDGFAPAEKYIKLVQNQALKTQYVEIFGALFSNLYTVFSGYTPSKDVSDYAKSLYDSVFQYLTTTKDISEGKFVSTKDNLISLAGLVKDPQVFQDLLQWYNDQANSKFANIEISKDNQWRIVILAHKQLENVLTEQQKKDLFNKQAEIDKSDTVLYNRRTCESILDIASSDKSRAEKRWESFMTSSETKYFLEFAEIGFNQPKFKENIQKYYDLYFGEDLLNIFKNNSVANASQFARIMYPKNQEFRWQLESLDKLLPRVPQGQSTLLRYLQDQRDIVAEQVKIFEKYYGY